MAEVIWRNEALDEIDLITAYIRQFDPVAANRIGQALIDLGNSLAEFPRRGRPAANEGRRELVNVSPYVLTYEVEAEVVNIVRVRDSRRRPLED